MSRTLPDHSPLLTRLRGVLAQQSYCKRVIQTYCSNADRFLHYLARREISVETVRPTDLSRYLRCALRRFHQRHGRAPSSPPDWRAVQAAGIHALLRLVQKRWPPEPTASDPGTVFCQALCGEYQEWLSVQRGLATETVRPLVEEARRFISCYTARTGAVDLAKFGVADIDTYFQKRSSGLRRNSRKALVYQLRCLLRFLHGTGRTPVDLAPRVIAPTLYAYEAIPSAVRPDEIHTVLESAREDLSPIGLRDYAILLLLSTYGMRDGEITHLRLDDIDWRTETLRVRHSKTGAHSLLPLMSPVGEALLDYLRRGRPRTEAREIFIRSCAPYRRLSSFYHRARQRIEAAGVQPLGKRGPHAFRHARAVSLLRGGVPPKIIGDLLGHRSAASTIPYLKLATEDLRAVALEIPGSEVRP